MRRTPLLAIFSVVAACSVQQASAVTLTFGSAVANPDFNFTFQNAIFTVANGLSDGTLSWSPNQVFQVYHGASMPSFITAQGFSNSSYVAYFAGNVDVFHTYQPEVISSQNGADLTALSFQFGTGYNPATFTGYWEAFKDGTMIGSGNFNTIGILNFSDSSGFDQIKIGTYSEPFTSFDGPFVSGNGVLASDAAGIFAVAPVPEPSTWAMMILGFAGVGFMTYRRRKLAMA